MNPAAPGFVTRAASSVFITLFFIAPICSLFLPVCSTQWMLGVVLVPLLLFLLTWNWTSEQSDAPGTVLSMAQPPISSDPPAQARRTAENLARQTAQLPAARR